MQHKVNAIFLFTSTAAYNQSKSSLSFVNNQLTKVSESVFITILSKLADKSTIDFSSSKEM